MPKYLFQASYAAEGIKGLEKDKASGRKAALRPIHIRLIGFTNREGAQIDALVAKGPGLMTARPCQKLQSRGPQLPDRGRSADRG